jgi:sugar phosphate permease
MDEILYIKNGPYLFACHLVASWYSNLNTDGQFVGKWNASQNLGRIICYAIEDLHGSPPSLQMN